MLAAGCSDRICCVSRALAGRSLMRRLLCLTALAPLGCSVPAPLPPDPSPPMFSAEPIPTAGDAYNHTSSIVALPDGALAVAWTAGTKELADDTRIVMSRRAAGASDWSTVMTVADTPGKPDANCMLFIDKAQRLHLMHSSMFA